MKFWAPKSKPRPSDSYGSSYDRSPAFTASTSFTGEIARHRRRAKFLKEHPEVAVLYRCICGAWKSPYFAYCQNCQEKLDLLRTDQLAAHIWGKGNLAKK